MSHEARIVEPTFPYDLVRLEDGTKQKPPDGWALLKPGDATLTRRVKSSGPSWTVQVKKGRKVFSHGVWAPAEIIDVERQKLEAERQTPEFKRKRLADLTRREKKHAEYVEDFHAAVLDFLNFAPCHADVAEELAKAVGAHATDVGSGTVARTERIPIEARAEAAVIAWLRHQTTDYDRMHIARVKGERRAVRRQLAEWSRMLLQGYREGAHVPASCPLQKALDLKPGSFSDP